MGSFNPGFVAAPVGPDPRRDIDLLAFTAPASGSSAWAWAWALVISAGGNGEFMIRRVCIDKRRERRKKNGKATMALGLIRDEKSKAPAYRGLFGTMAHPSLSRTAKVRRGERVRESYNIHSFRIQSTERED